MAARRNEDDRTARRPRNPLCNQRVRKPTEDMVNPIHSTYAKWTIVRQHQREGRSIRTQPRKENIRLQHHACNGAKDEVADPRKHKQWNSFQREI